MMLTVRATKVLLTIGAIITSMCAVTLAVLLTEYTDIQLQYNHFGDQAIVSANISCLLSLLFLIRLLVHYCSKTYPNYRQVKWFWRDDDEFEYVMWLTFLFFQIISMISGLIAYDNLYILTPLYTTVYLYGQLVYFIVYTCIFLCLVAGFCMLYGFCHCDGCCPCGNRDKY